MTGIRPCAPAEPYSDILFSIKHQISSGFLRNVNTELFGSPELGKFEIHRVMCLQILNLIFNFVLRYRSLPENLLDERQFLL